MCWRGINIITVKQLASHQKHELLQQAAAQLEALLWVGFKLDLQQLLAHGLRFLRQNADRTRLLGGTLNDTEPSTLGINHSNIFSLRVLAAAGGARGAELLRRSCTQQPLGVALVTAACSQTSCTTMP